MKVLSTKVLDAATLNLATNLGLQVDCAELVETRPVEFDITAINKDFDAIIFTSSNAVKYFFDTNGSAQLITDKKVFGTSGKTRSALISAGFIPQAVAENASSLADLISADEQIKSVLHICGNFRLDTLENRMKATGRTYHPLIVYETVPKNDFVQSGNYDALMFYSPSGIEAYTANNKLDANCLYSCIGETTAAALKTKNEHLNLLISTEPSPYAMIEQIATYFNLAFNKNPA